MKIDFCLPVYNEEKIMKGSVVRLLEFCQSQNWNFNWQIALLINGSRDQSLEIARQLAERHPDRIVCFDYPEAGRGRALKKYYLASQADILTYMDIDLAVSLDNIQPLIDPIICGQADMVIGSRLLPESRIKRSFIRELSSQSYNYLSRIILGHKFSDMQCGFKAVKTESFKKLSPFITDTQWFFDTEMIAFGHLFDYRIKEIPVDWSENRWDERKSKVKMFRDSFKFFINLLDLKFRLISAKNRG